jgi:hypothetical protein
MLIPQFIMIWVEMRIFFSRLESWERQTRNENTFRNEILTSLSSWVNRWFCSINSWIILDLSFSEDRVLFWWSSSCFCALVKSAWSSRSLDSYSDSNVSNLRRSPCFSCSKSCKNRHQIQREKRKDSRKVLLESVNDNEGLHLFLLVIMTHIPCFRGRSLFQRFTDYCILTQQLQWFYSTIHGTFSSPNLNTLFVVLRFGWISLSCSDDDEQDNLKATSHLLPV